MTSTEDYVTKSQIRTLFSTFTRQLKSGKLKAPVAPPDNTQNNDTENNVDDDTFVPSVDNDEVVQEEFMDIAEDVIARIATWEIGSWIVIRYKRQWIPGRIIPDERKEQLEEGLFIVECMERKKSGINSFRWPRSRDLAVLNARDLLLQIDQVTPVKEVELSTEEII